MGDPSISILRNLVRYNPETGLLIWTERTAKDFCDGTRPSEMKARIFNLRYAGKPALSAPTAQGYLAGTFERRGVKAHRAAWALFYGAWPSQPIDHINGDRSDNRIENLRLATIAENARNTKPRINSTSQFKGVSRERDGVWRSMLYFEKRRVYIGTFKSEIEAAVAYDLFAHAFFGEFARPNFPETSKDALTDFVDEYARNHTGLPIDGVRTWAEKVAV